MPILANVHLFFYLCLGLNCFVAALCLQVVKCIQEPKQWAERRKKRKSPVTMCRNEVRVIWSALVIKMRFSAAVSKVLICSLGKYTDFIYRSHLWLQNLVWWVLAKWQKLVFLQTKQYSSRTMINCVSEMVRITGRRSQAQTSIYLWFLFAQGHEMLEMRVVIRSEFALKTLINLCLPAARLTQGLHQNS